MKADKMHKAIQLISMQAVFCDCRALEILRKSNGAVINATDGLHNLMDCIPIRAYKRSVLCTTHLAAILFFCLGIQCNSVKWVF